MENGGYPARRPMLIYSQQVDRPSPIVRWEQPPDVPPSHRDNLEAGQYPSGPSWNNPHVLRGRKTIIRSGPDVLTFARPPRRNSEERQCGAGGKGR